MILIHTDLLRNVLNCPEPLVWQKAFLTSELEYIYKHSRPFRIRAKPHLYRQGKGCVRCFAVHETHQQNVPCHTCAMPMHPPCIQLYKEGINQDPVQTVQCPFCRYPAALALEKHFERPQVSPAVAIPEPVPTSGLVPVSIKASPGSHRLVTDAIQPSVEAASSNSMQQRTAPQEPQSAAPQRCTSTPLPGNPAQIWLER